MRTLHCLPTGLVLMAACHGRALYDSVPLRDDGKQCRRYAEGLEYCGERERGLPAGRGTMRMPDGKELTGTWAGSRVRDGELKIDANRILYADDFEDMRPFGSFLIRNSSTSEKTQVLVNGRSRQEITYRADGTPRRIAESEGNGEKSVTLLEPSGTETFYRERNGKPDGDVVSIAQDGSVTLRIYADGADVTRSALPDRVIETAREIAVAEATMEARKAAEDRQSATRARKTAEANQQRAKEAADELRADDSLKTPCTCIVEKRSKGESPLLCHRDPPYDVPSGSECSCTFRGCIIVASADDRCDADCEKARKAEQELRDRRCHADRNAFWQSHREKFLRRTQLCARFPDDPTAVSREWDRLLAEHNSEVERDLAAAQQVTRAKIAQAQQAVQAAVERERAARARIEAAKRADAAAFDANLRRERDMARQRIEDVMRRQAEDARRRRRERCAMPQPPCGCRPYTPVPGTYGACPA